MLRHEFSYFGKMGKRYYCDYCDKSFADNVQNRKKHIQGGQHQSLKKIHYLAFKEPEEILAEESAKRPCQRFSRTGECSFGPNCRYSHLTPQRRQELLFEIEERKRQKIERSRLEDKQVPENIPTVEDWLKNRLKRRKTEETKPKIEGEGVAAGTADNSLPIFSLPLVLQGIPDLPPSLIPPSAECLMRAKDVDWG